jgi:FAD/FMN-containing dehydrogenase/Fe-S oxidoreductase
MQEKIESLKKVIEGGVHTDILTRTMYATDASVYKEIPVAVVYPKNENDIRTLIRFANDNHIGLIPRTAGTSLAGQVVGSGIVVDVSRYLTRILEINPEERYAWVEPGVVLDELNLKLAPYGLFFGPETSTGNRCMLGGMLGNNACGLHSLVYGSTRDHTLAVRALLSDGSSAEFTSLSVAEFHEKCKGDLLENRIYRKVNEILSSTSNASEIRSGYPDPSVPRRNNGYALDLLLETDPFTGNGKEINLCKLLGGSEGTLAFFSAIKLNLVDLPSSHKVLVCVHFDNLRDCINANLVALEHRPTAIELMDSTVLECTHSNRSQEANRFFLQGDPRAILIIELAAASDDGLRQEIGKVIDHFKSENLGYAYPVVFGQEMKKVWNLRKAGLGLLANIPGDHKAVSIIEDTAVPVQKQADYILEMQEMFTRNHVQCVFHAHIATGELHMRPTLNLKDPADVSRFRQIAWETLRIVKKYRGSFSGEHGDGRLRASFLPELLGDHNYQLIKEIKNTFDPNGILNPGKITDPPPMDQFLRNEPGTTTPIIETIYDFSSDLGIMRAIEKCNGSGDCRKSQQMGGTMCPSYQATLDERNSTRARANILREFMYQEPGRNRFDHQEIYEILDLCLSCKACKSECPSSVDMAKLKGEFLQQWQDIHGIPFRSRLIANLPRLYRLVMPVSTLANIFLGNKVLSGAFKQAVGFHTQRSIPPLSPVRTRKWASKQILKINPSGTKVKGTVYLFIDEFTDYQDSGIGIKAIRLLTRLGYEVKLSKTTLSARTYISKGLLRKAALIARDNVHQYKELITEKTPLIGIEPSAILGFRDEFPDLVGPGLKAEALKLAPHCLLLDEFIEREMKSGNIRKSDFTSSSKHVLLHGHCQQKAVASTAATRYILAFPENYTCSEIPSGCCGMAGAFGYEKEHYDLSMKVGEMVLFPAVREADQQTIICAPGTSCRHHISDGTGRRAYHPAEILFDALNGQ